jgi:hypothetical protein
VSVAIVPPTDVSMSAAPPDSLSVPFSIFPPSNRAGPVT